MNSPRPNKGHKRDDSQASYYFVSHDAGTSEAVRDTGDETEVIEETPQGATADFYAPRQVNTVDPRLSIQSYQQGPRRGQATTTQGGKKTPKFSALTAADLDGAKKVDPKVFFSKERTFLSWMHTSIWLAGTSLAITSYSETGSASAIYGLLMMPVAIIFIIYAMVQYAKRSYMLAIRSPGPYEDKYGPVLLGSFFIGSLMLQFVYRLYEWNL